MCVILDSPLCVGGRLLYGGRVSAHSWLAGGRPTSFSAAATWVLRHVRGVDGMPSHEALPGQHKESPPPPPP